MPCLLGTQFVLQSFCTAIDTISIGEVIKDPQVIVSPGSVFKLGFFSPVNSTSRYLGIWYNVSETSVIWVANRGTPLFDSSGIVTVNDDGNIVLMNGKGEIFWSSNLTNSATNANAHLLDSGNLVLRDVLNGQILWESFRHPSDTFLPSMRISHNVLSGEKVMMTSWLSSSNPDIGRFTSGLNAVRVPQFFIWNGSKPLWRSGPWNGRVLTGITDMPSAYLNGFNVVNDNNGNVYITRTSNDKLLSRIVLDSEGNLTETVWDGSKENWNIIWSAPRGDCGLYDKCGLFGICTSQDFPSCTCPRGFQPENREEWERGNWSGGCVRLTPLQCDRRNNSRDGEKDDGFLKLSMVKVPDFIEWSSGLETECRSLCLKNCSCIAYAYDFGIGCMFWSRRLIDIQKFSNGGLDLYIRLAYTDLNQKRGKKLIIIVPVISSLAIICAFIFLCWWRCMAKHKGNQIRRKPLLYVTADVFSSDSYDQTIKDDLDAVNLEELPLYSFEIIANATEQFSVENKLGEGGFGPVYKGKLANGKEIAVKRLSRTSGQGLQEFMNELAVISKLQHRNLVRLLGCCIEKDEKMLIYEYMLNGSLDFFLFDPSQTILDWRIRLNIIEGIGRGLLYLHRDSRLRIIHRDLKPSNILLDEDWNPKVSDFGMARIFGIDQVQDDTKRVVGTYGYMAPEYAIRGRFSEKSDVYSFGVLMLEIISGRRNTSFYHDELASSLLGYAWKLWNEENIVALIDSRISSPSHEPEIIRRIHIGLLCVQESAMSRPTIPNVLSMLSSEIPHLPMPEKPAFTVNESSSEGNNINSINRVSITVLDGR